MLKAAARSSALTLAEARSETHLTQTIIRLTPYTQYLESFAFCYDEGLCDKETSRAFVCDKIWPYETMMETILAGYPVLLAEKLKADRPLRETILWSDCEAEGGKT